MGPLDYDVGNIIAEGFQLAKVLSNILTREELKFGSFLGKSLKSIGQTLLIDYRYIYLIRFIYLIYYKEKPN